MLDVFEALLPNCPERILLLFSSSVYSSLPESGNWELSCEGRMASVLYQRRKSNHLSDKAGRCLVTSGSSEGLQSWFVVYFWIPVLNLTKTVDRD